MDLVSRWAEVVAAVNANDWSLVRQMLTYDYHHIRRDDPSTSQVTDVLPNLDDAMTAYEKMYGEAGWRHETLSASAMGPVVVSTYRNHLAGQADIAGACVIRFDEAGHVREILDVVPR